MLVHFRFSFSADYTKDLFGPQLANLEGRRELEPNCVPHLFLGTLLGTSWLAIGQFFSLSLNGQGPIPKHNTWTHNQQMFYYYETEKSKFLQRAKK